MSAGTSEPLSSEEARHPTNLTIVLVAFFGLAALIALATRRPGGSIDFFERGHWLGPASDMLAGKIPYRDTFPVHGFLSDGGLDLLLFATFGPNYRLSLAAHFLIGILFQPSLYLVAAMATRRPALAAAAIPLNVAMATEILADRPVLPLLGLAAFLWALDHPPSRGRAALAGCLAGIGLLYALEFGMFVLVAELTALAFSRIAIREFDERPIAARPFFLGLGAVLLPFCAYLGLVGALIPFLKTSFLDLPLRIHSVWGWAFPAPWTLLRLLSTGQPYRIGALRIGFGVAKRLYLCPLLGGLGILVALGIRRRFVCNPLVLRLVTVSVACLCFFRYVVARLHLEVGNALTGPLLLLILVAGCDAYRRAFPARKRRLTAAIFVVAGGLIGLSMNAIARSASLVGDAIQYRNRMAARTNLVPLAFPRGGGALVPAAEAREIATLDDWFRRELPPGASVLELTNRPALYFFLQRPNATRFYQVPLMGPFQSEVLRDLQEKPPAAVLLQRATPYDTTDGVPNPAWIPRVWQYLDRNFTRRVRVGATLIALPQRARERGKTP
jgi:hypothetical protein